MMLPRLARFCYGRRRYVLIAWILALVLLGVVSATAGGKNVTDFSLPGTESQRSFDLLKANFPAKSGDTADLVFAARGPGGVRDPAVQRRMESAFGAAQRSTRFVSGVASPFAPNGERQISQDGKVAFAVIQFNVKSNDLPKGTAARIHDDVVRAAAPGHGLDVEFSGNAFSSRTAPGGSELVGILAAVVILLLAFGSLLAMACRSSIALFGIGIGLSGIAVLANFIDIVSFTGLIAAMIGIGVGIDYALFIVTRYRQGLHDGLEPGEAVATAINTSGRAVLFAGCTVVISLMGMFLIGLSFVNGLAIGAALTVLVTMVASVTLLPAMLGFCGHNIDKFHVPALHRSAGTAETRGGFWFRWSRGIQRRPWPYALAATALLVVLAFPALHLRLGNPDAGNDPKGSTTRKAYDLLANGFGPGYNGPLTVAARLPEPSDLAVMQRLETRLRAHPGVAGWGRWCPTILAIRPRRSSWSPRRPHRRTPRPPRSSASSVTRSARTVAGTQPHRLLGRQRRRVDRPHPEAVGTPAATSSAR